jgi:hypothetical protein
MELKGSWIGDGTFYYPWRRIDWMKICKCHETYWCVYVRPRGQFESLKFVFQDEQTARNSLEYLMRHSPFK